MLKKRLISIKRLIHKFFPVNVANFLRAPILKNICKRVFLWQQKCFFGCAIISPKITTSVRFSLGCIFFWKISSCLSLKRLCHNNTGSSQRWNAGSRFAIHVCHGHSPLLSSIPFQSFTTDK